MAGYSLLLHVKPDDYCVMKKVFAIILFALVAVNISFAQTHNKQMDNKQVSGRYGSNEGICLFEDGEFMLFGYATAVFGYYKINHNGISFYPDKPAPFEVYAGVNKSIGDSTKFNFVGFDGRSQTFISFNQERVYQVFNEDANCFDGPFVYQVPQKIKKFTLYGPTKRNADSKPVAFVHQSQGDFNDFIIFYNPVPVESEDFIGIFTQSEGWDVIKLSNYGGETGYSKIKQDEDEQKQWKEVLEMKSQYDQSKISSEEGIFANRHYKTFLRNVQDYNFDPISQLYTSKKAAEDEQYFLSNPFSDDRYLRKFSKQALHSTNSTIMAKDISPNPIFFTICADPERSYHYTGIPRQKETEGEKIMPTIAAPLPIKNNR